MASTTTATPAHPLDYRATVFTQDPDPSTDPPSRYSFEYSTAKQCYRRLSQGEVVNLSTGELRPHSCGSNSCPRCAQVKRRKIVRAVRASDPDAMVTLTQVGDDWSVIRDGMKNLRQRLQRAGYCWEWCWLVECNEKMHQHHVHALVHGAVPEQWAWAEHAEASGFGSDVQFSLLKDTTASARYLWGMDSYKRPKGKDGKPKPRKHKALCIPHFLLMNGGRYEHSTHGFWRVNGEPVKGGWQSAHRALA